MGLASYSIDQFAKDAERVVREKPTESEVMRNIRPLLEKLLLSGNLPLTLSNLGRIDLR